MNTDIKLVHEPRCVPCEHSKFYAYVFEFVSNGELWSCAAYVHWKRPLTHLSFCPSHCAIASYARLCDYRVSSGFGWYRQEQEHLRGLYFGGAIPAFAWKKRSAQVCNENDLVICKAFVDAAAAFHAYVDCVEGVSPQSCVVPVDGLPYANMSAFTSPLISQFLANAQDQIANLEQELSSVRAQCDTLNQENATLKKGQARMSADMETDRAAWLRYNKKLETENSKLQQENFSLRTKYFHVACAKGA